MLAVLDTSAILSGKRFTCPAVTVPLVLDEFREGGHSWRLLQYARSAGLTVRHPSQTSLDEVEAAARHTGDHYQLSLADLQVLALALDVQKEGILFTDDYGMQNVAAALGISFQGVLQAGISQQWQWRYRCTSCGHNITLPQQECPVCGGPVKRVRFR